MKSYKGFDVQSENKQLISAKWKINEHKNHTFMMFQMITFISKNYFMKKASYMQDKLIVYAIVKREIKKATSNCSLLYVVCILLFLFLLLVLCCEVCITVNCKK